MQPQQGMNINTRPTQIASPVVPGDSGRGEEEAPLVADDVTAIEEAMHDAIDEDDYDTLQYLNTGAYDDRGLMAHVATRPQTVKPLCICAIPGSVCWHT